MMVEKKTEIEAVGGEKKGTNVIIVLLAEDILSLALPDVRVTNILQVHIRLINIIILSSQICKRAISGIEAYWVGGTEALCSDRKKSFFFLKQQRDSSLPRSNSIA